MLYTGPLVVLTSRVKRIGQRDRGGRFSKITIALLIIGSDHTFCKGSVAGTDVSALELGAMKAPRVCTSCPAASLRRKICWKRNVRCLFWFILEDVVKRRWITRFRPRLSRPSSACRETPRHSGKPVEQPLLAEIGSKGPRPGSPKTRNLPRLSRTTKRPPARRASSGSPTYAKR